MADDSPALSLADHRFNRASIEMPVIYFAHPVGAPDPRLVQANVERSLAWLHWLYTRYPGVAFECSWIGHVLAMQDETAHRAAGMAMNLRQAEHCDGIALTGGFKTDGMKAELERIVKRGGWVHDFTELGRLPPALGTIVVRCYTRYFAVAA